MGPFNLGNPGEFTMLELAQVLIISLSNVLDIASFPLVLLFIFIYFNLSFASLL